MRGLHKRTKKSRCIEPNKAHSFRILLAEDDVEMRHLVSWALSEKGYDVVQCRNGDELMKQLGLLGPSEIAKDIDLVISDIRMPGTTGLQVLESAKDLEGFPPFILITAFPVQEIREQAEQLNARALFAKPFEIEALVNKVEQITQEGFASGNRRCASRSTVQPTVRFPIDVLFFGDFESGPLEKSVKEEAGKLNRYREAISSCWVQVYRRKLPQVGIHDWYVHIEMSVHGKTLTINHDPHLTYRYKNPYLAIRLAFATARRRLNSRVHHQQSRKSIRHDFMKQS